MAKNNIYFIYMFTTTEDWFGENKYSNESFSISIPHGNWHTEYLKLQFSDIFTYRNTMFDSMFLKHTRYMTVYVCDIFLPQLIKAPFSNYSQVAILIITLYAIHCTEPSVILLPDRE